MGIEGVAQNRMEGQKTGQGGRIELPSADGMVAVLPYPRCCSIVGLFQMHQALQLHHLHQGRCREKKKYSFFSFSLMRGWCRVAGFVTNAPGVTVAPFAPRGVQREEEVSFLFFLLDEGLVHGGGVCYRCTRCYSCTKYDKTKGAGSYFMFLTLKLFYYNYLKIW